MVSVYFTSPAFVFLYCVGTKAIVTTSTKEISFSLLGTFSFVSEPPLVIITPYSGDRDGLGTG